MSRRAADVLALAACGLATLLVLAPRAHAQDSITVTVRDFTGRAAGDFDLMDLATTSAVPISQGECDAGAEITFRFTNVDPMRSNLFFYQGANCDDVAIRNDTTDDRCSLLAGPFTTEMRTQVDVTLPVSELVPCGEGGSGTREIFVLAVNNTMSDDVSGPGQLATFPIAYDFQGPAAPSDFEAVGGESSATLTWTADTSQITEWEIFLDPNGCTGGTVDSALLADPNAPDPSALVDTAEGTASSFDLPFPASVPIGGEAAVAIRAVDRAGNVGTLSPVRCVSRFDVTTWLEAFCAGDGSGSEVCTDGGCSVSPAGGDGRLAWLLIGAAAALAFYRRRTR
jgi:MYXO-CTERM domain-containing protein